MSEARPRIERVAARVVESCLKVHRLLGPGLLESAYQRCLAHELEQNGLEVIREVAIPLSYGAIDIEIGYRADMIVDGCILVENKTVSSILPIHEAQLLTYLKLTGLRLGFLVNWNVVLVKDGIRRFVNRL